MPGMMKLETRIKKNGWKIVVDGDVARISLPCGRVALIDAEDAEKCRLYAWRSVKPSNAWYAYTSIKVGDENKTLYLHRFLMGNPQGMEIDHKNYDGLDNRKENLRQCTRSQNCAAKRPKTQGVRGVSKSHETNGRYFAKITASKKTIHLGSFGSQEEAAIAYDLAAIQMFGEFSRPNCAVRLG